VFFIFLAGFLLRAQIDRQLVYSFSEAKDLVCEVNISTKSDFKEGINSPARLSTILSEISADIASSAGFLDKGEICAGLQAEQSVLPGAGLEIVAVDKICFVDWRNRGGGINIEVDQIFTNMEAEKAAKFRKGALADQPDTTYLYLQTISPELQLDHQLILEIIIRYVDSYTASGNNLAK